ncbi:bifunctional MaoC family dehydratase N-terminal/OB-fold nucleic acid binding domain-containing protein [Gordonia sp. CPCC 205333]|uniref:bifunctional MaoC family dehydratase N-terminal/OB-fold nucleic acid binding domain-containing protein n=1 Tax=Gordonia sp. CPCC 205333 TaxID=3140790 RepID=UPI003AF3B6CA
MSRQTEQIVAAAEKIKSAGMSEPVAGRDPINRPMINNWVEAMGDANPIYSDDAAARAAGHDGIVAPPAMAQVWTMRGLNGQRTQDDPLGAASQLFDDAGFTSVVATNCDSTYHRYTRPGERVSLSAELLDVVGPKQTALGEGWFFTTRNVWTVGDDVVAEMRFRILKFRPPSEGRGDDAVPADTYRDLDPSKLIRPTASRDTQFFWDGVRAHELRIQVRPAPAAGRVPGEALAESGKSRRRKPTASAHVDDSGHEVSIHLVARAPRHSTTQSREAVAPAAGRVPGEALAESGVSRPRNTNSSLQHPPVPAVWTERGADNVYPPTDYIVSAGLGTVYSFVVHHAPRVPGRELPFVVALVELDEGVRMLGQLRGVDPASVAIGDRVKAEFLDFPADPDDPDDQPWTLYAWRPESEGG